MLGTEVRTEVGPPAAEADLERTTYVCGIEPDTSSGQEERAANVGSVFALKTRLSEFEQPVRVHDKDPWGVETKVASMVLISAVSGPSKLRRESRERPGCDCKGI